MARIDPKILEKVGFSGNGVDVDPDVYARVPRNDESVFRAVVLNDGVLSPSIPREAGSRRT